MLELLYSLVVPLYIKVYKIKKFTCMSLKFDVKKKHVVRSERVKSVQLHSEMPWVLSSIYTGTITI